jgi:predicted phage terminase large subunit-like protein
MQDIEMQPGKQTQFLACDADVVFYGGTAFCAKSFSLLMDSTYQIKDPAFTGIIFRRLSTSIRTGGGLWDTANIIYRSKDTRGRLTISNLTARFPSGSKIKFSHLENESDVYAHHGGQYAYIGFDELTEFTKKQFMYLCTRNRGMSDYKGKCYIRATMNPDPDSFVRNIIDWWIGEDGYPIEERCGVVRHFTIENDEWVWVDKNWTKTLPDGTVVHPKTFTFINAKISDNPLGRKANPEYESNLYAQDEVTRERLLKGNWNISYKGNLLNPLWFRLIKANNLPKDLRTVRYWDMAATKSEEKDSGEPASTAGVKIGMSGGNLYIIDVYDKMDTPAIIERDMQDTAANDGLDTIVAWEEEKGSAGRYVSNHLKNDVFKGYTAVEDPVSGDKPSRCKPWSALAQNGHVFLVEAPWNKKFKSQASSFYTPGHKCDEIDGVSGGYKILHSMDISVRVVHNKIIVQDAKLPPPYIVYHAFSINEATASVVTCQWDQDVGRLHVNFEASMDTVEDMYAYITSTKGSVNIGPPELHSDAQRTVMTSLAEKGLRLTIDDDYDALASVYYLNSLVDKKMFSVNSICRDLLLSIQNDTEIKNTGSHLTALLYIINNVRIKRKSEPIKPMRSFSREKLRYQESQYKALRGQASEEPNAPGWGD